ncbi:MAG: outer membrane beta-barrel protein [Bacteroidales bacterium]|nr:outer membrane beta-barrel protein [Bacteroidales bacterium]
MKKLIFTAAVLMAGLTMSAQTKGDMYASGSLTVSGGSSKSTVTVTTNGNSTTKKDSNPSSTKFSISPEFGYFIMDNLAIEGSITYGMDKSLNQTVSTSDKNYYDYTHLFSIDPGVRYYVRLGSDKFWYTPGANLSLGFVQHVNRVNTDTTTKPKAPFAFGLSVDILAFEFKPAEQFGIVLRGGSLDWNLTTVSTKEEVSSIKTKTRVTSNTASLSLNSSLTIGFKYYF